MSLSSDDEDAKKVSFKSFRKQKLDLIKETTEKKEITGHKPSDVKDSDHVGFELLQER